MRLFLVVFMFLSLATAEAKSAKPADKKALQAAYNKRMKSKAPVYKAETLKKVKLVTLFKTNAFMKLSYSKRKAFFKAVADYMVATSPKRKTAFNYLEFLPESYAAGAQRNAGFLVSAGMFGSENFNTRYLLNGFPSECEEDNSPNPKNVPCYPGLGLSANGKALCVANTPGTQLQACLDKSKAENGFDNLDRVLRADPSNAQVREAIGKNMQMIDAECKGSSGGYCTKLNSSVAALDTAKGIKLSSFYEGGVSVPPADDPIPGVTSDGSCGLISNKAMEDVTGKMDARWKASVNLAGRVCPQDPSYDALFSRYGVCPQTEGDGSDARESRREPSDILKGALAGMNSEMAMSPTQSREFTKYFGITPTEYKSVYCDSAKDPKSFAAALSKLSNGHGGRTIDGLSDDGMAYMAAALENFRRRSDDAERNSLIDGFRALRTKVNDGTLPKFNGTRSEEYEAGVREQNERAMAAIQTFENYLKGSATRDQVLAINSAQKNWVMSNLSKADNSAFKILAAQLMNEKDAGRVTSATKLLPGEVAQADKAFGRMNACLEKAVRVTEGGKYEDSTADTHYGNDCNVKSEYAGILTSPGSDFFKGRGAVILETPGPEKKCYKYKKDLDVGVSPAESHRIEFESPLTPGAPQIMTIQELLSRGFLVKAYSCEVDEPAKAPASGGGDMVP